MNKAPLWRERGFQANQPRSANCGARYVLSPSGGSRLFALSYGEEILLRRALFESIQRAHQLVVFGDATALGS